jgi:Domain of unknown function (DUF6916)
MTFSRRLFIKAASGATLIATLPQAFVNIFGQDKRKSIQGAPTGTGTLGIPVEGNVDPLYYYNSAAFSSYVGSTFRVYVSRARHIDLKLGEVRQLRPAVPGKDGFALVFQDTRANRLRSGLYEIEHSALGALSLMLGPVNQDGTSYEAVINRQYP